MDTKLIMMMCLVTPDMTIAPMSTSDRAWLWNVGADVSEGEPEAITVSVRVANAESKS